MTEIEPHVEQKIRRSTPGILLLRLAIYVMLAGYFLAGLGYLTIRYHVWPNLDHWRPEIVAQISSLLQRPVSISQISTGFDGWQPMVTVRGLRLAGPEPEGAAKPDEADEPFAIAEARAVVALRTFLTGRLRLSELQLDGLRVTVERERTGRLSVAGIPIADNVQDGRLLGELLAQRDLKVRSSVIVWRDALLERRERIEDVDIDLHNIGRRHRLEFRSARPGRLATGFEATAELFRHGSRPTDWAQWTGDLYAAGSGVSTDAVAATLGLKPPVQGARAEFKFWARLDQLQLNDLQLKLSGQAMRIELPQGEALAVDRFTAEGSAVRRPDGSLDLVVRKLEGQTDAGFALRAAGDQSLTLDARRQPMAGRFAVEEIDVAGALVIARRLPLPAPLQARLASVQLRGHLRDFRARFDRRQALEYESSARFEQLSLAQVAPQPSFENLSGNFKLNQQRGEASFEGRNSVLTVPAVFEDPRIPLDEIQGKFSWSVAERESGRLQLLVEELKFANADAAGQVSGSYELVPNGPGIADLKGSLSRGEVTRVARYLPVRLSPKVRGWVAESILAGQIPEARFAVRGNLSAFPFRNAGDGEFLIEARVNRGTLEYSSEWPRIENFDGLLRFAGAGMDIRMDSGRLFSVDLSEVRAQIAEFREPLLVVEGRGHGPARDLVRFLNDSPMRTRLDDFTRDTVVTGDAGLQVRLDLPLDNLKATRVSGTVQFDKNDLTLDSTIPRFDGVSGQLNFSDGGLALVGLTATFLGGPLKVDGTTPEQGRFLINATGSLSAENLRAVVDNPLTQKLSGRTDYRASIDVFKRSARIQVESDLVGLAADLPEPLRKAAGESWPLRAQSTPIGMAAPGERGTGDRIEATILDKIRLVFERGRNPQTQKLQIRRGAFAYDAQATMADTGFVVLVNRSDIDVDRWLDLLTSPSMQAAAARSSDEFATGFTMLPTLVSVVSDRLTIVGKQLHDVVFGASRQGGLWRANISAREINGHFNWSEARAGQRIGALTARFSRLEIPSSHRVEVESLLETAPRELPSLDISAEEFVLSDRSLGRLSLQATTGGTEAAPLWHLNSLRIDNPAAVLQASGLWAAPSPGEPRRTRLDYRLDLNDAGELLARYGMNNLVKGGAGSLTGMLTWAGSPLSLHYPSLSGSTEVRIGKGQFLKTEPGIAKLIGVLNLQFLPRRLSLDFSDVFAEGFSFDEIEGQVNIARGIARTDELRMKGVQAQVRMKGEVDLARERQQIEVEVRPELNAGLASLAYAALANPAIGLTTFIAQTLLRKPLEDIFTYTYDVSGSWSDPQVVERRQAPIIRSEPTP